MANTFASAITTDFLQKGVITPLQSRLAPLKAFTTQFEPDPVKPLATVQIKVATSGSTTNVDPTDFTANSGTTLSAAAVTMHQLSHPFSITNKELNSGIELRDLFELNVNLFTRTLLNRVLAPVTAVNFPAAPLISAAASFAVTDLDFLWAAIHKSKIKNVILQGNYFVRVLNKPGFYQPTGTESGGAWKPFGWDFIGQNDEWSGAGTDIVGFACNPQALGVVLGLPIQLSVPNMETRRLPLPMIGAEVYLNMWFDVTARTTYVTFDCMLGTTLLDGSAGVLVKSS